MAGVNKVILVGNLGTDPEVKTANGGSFAVAPLATSESWKDKTTGERKEKTEWHNLVFGKNLLDVVTNYVKKGSKIYVEGKISSRSYEKDGQTKYATSIIVSTITMLDKRIDSADSAEGVKSPVGSAEASAGDYMSKAQTGTQAPTVSSNVDDDMPF